MAKKLVKFIQANLHHAKGASGILCRRFAKENMDVALLQEPWTNNNNILGISTNKRRLIYDNSQLTPRAAILVSVNIKFTPIPEFISRDIVAIQMEVPTSRGRTEIVVISAYFPGDSEEVPPKEVAEIIDRCRKNSKQFVIGCDANSHHTTWGSNDINKRGECLFEFIISNNIDICNQGNKPTFVNAIRQEVLDITICSTKLSEKIVNWHVSDEVSLSDHMHIEFNYDSGEILEETYRDPRQTNWEMYATHFPDPSNTCCEIRTVEELEEASQGIMNNILTAYNESCPVKTRSSNRDASWWNKKLEKLRKVTRRLFNRAKVTSNWELYRKALTEYNREIRKSRRRDWRLMCEKVEHTSTTARLQKILAKDHTNGLGLVKKDNGQFTNDVNETLGIMMDKHFPGSIVDSGGSTPSRITGSTGTEMARTESYNLASNIFTESTVEWAVNSFDPFKSPGEDGIMPVMLQKGKRAVICKLLEIYRASLALSYIPLGWRKTRVVFIPKAGKRDKTLPKAFRPISLSSIFLKVMEKIIDLHIKTKCLKTFPISKFQYAYQENKSTVTALHMLVKKIENSIEMKEISLAAFLDIEGAFDNASYPSMRRAMIKHGFGETITSWIEAMLTNREILIRLGGSSLTAKTTRGCPQGGVLSPLLWSLVVDDLLKNLTAKGFEVIGFADDVVILVRGKYDHIISNRMQQALNYILEWCKREGLNINPSKTTIIPFTRRRKFNISSLRLGNTVLQISTKVKYLGITLDQKLNWNAHIEQVINKATSALWVCSRTFGKKWGLRPHMIHWLYLAVVKPRITYASLVWWPKTKETSTQKKLSKIQRLACVSITGAIRSAPSRALDAMLCLLPLHESVQLEAEKSALRLKRQVKLMEGDMTGHLRILREFQINKLLVTNEDWMANQPNFNQGYTVIETTREIWAQGGPDVRQGSTIFYTDGSKMDNATGAGITGPGINISIPMGRWPTVFQAEIYAILECVRVCLARNYRYANICIFSDSQAALNALKSFQCRSKLVWECIQSLSQLCQRNQVNLYWVPGHCGVEGNEKADTLARLGSSTHFIGPEPFCGVSSSALKMELISWESRKIELNWRCSVGALQAKRFIQPNSKKRRNLLRLNKKDLSTITGLFTGHCPTRYHLKKLGKLDNESCRLCNLEAETSEHLLCECSALFQCRLKMFGRAIVEPHDIWSASPNVVVRFIRSAIPNWDVYN